MRFKKLLLTLSILIVCLVMTNAVNAAEAAIVVEPAYSEVPAPGETFTVNITITGAADLWGWSCVVSWDSSVVNCTKHELGPFNPDGAFLLGFIDNDVGEIPELAMGTLSEDAETGDGVLAILTFTAKEVGDVNLTISEAKYINYPAQEVTDIPVNQQAEIIVIPEFPAFLIIPVFLIATAAMAILAKRCWSRRSQDYVNA